MKSFLVPVLLAVSLAFVLADPSASSDEKEDKAIRECNVTNPVLRGEHNSKSNVPTYIESTDDTFTIF